MPMRFPWTALPVAPFWMDTPAVPLLEITFPASLFAPHHVARDAVEKTPGSRFP